MRPQCRSLRSRVLRSYKDRLFNEAAASRGREAVDGGRVDFGTLRQKSEDGQDSRVLGEQKDPYEGNKSRRWWADSCQRVLRDARRHKRRSGLAAATAAAETRGVERGRGHRFGCGGSVAHLDMRGSREGQAGWQVTREELAGGGRPELCVWWDGGGTRDMLQ